MDINHFLMGKRVFLRPLESGDTNRAYQWINDPELRRYLTAYLPQSYSRQVDWVTRANSDPEHDQIYAIVFIDGGVHIGNMGLHGIHWVDRSAGTGALIGSKDHHGKGLGTEAKMLLLNYAFMELNLRKIYSSVISFNARSLSYQTKCGYRIEGVRRDQVFHEGSYYDLILTAVFGEDWLKIWPEYKRTYLT